MNAQAILGFWYQEIETKQWFQQSSDFDELCRNRFLDIHSKVIAGECFEWRKTAQGRLAEIIVIDQLSRNIFRNSPQSFLSDPLALILSQEAISLGADKLLSTSEKSFLYMPFMHSESLIIHTEAVKLFSQPGLENNYDFELQHQKIIKRFGRYPHRNKILGRKSSKEELDYVKEHSGF